MSSIRRAMEELERRVREPLGLKLVDVLGDGNCFFHALALELLDVLGERSACALLCAAVRAQLPVRLGGHTPRHCL